MRIVSLYILFALIATAANLSTQAWVGAIDPSRWKFWTALAAGTAVGLVVKYILDRRYIFLVRKTGGSRHLARSFLLYSMSGGALTLLFWGTELAFYHGFPSWAEAKYVGGALSLAAGYWIKYHLDKRFAFSPASTP